MRTTTSTAAGLALVGALLAGCGGSSTDASTEDFCESYAGLFLDLAFVDPRDPGSGAEEMQDWADEMEDVGTPADMPDDARRGHEAVLETLRRADQAAADGDLQRVISELGRGDVESGQAYTEYGNRECVDEMQQMQDDLQERMSDPDHPMGELGEQVDPPDIGGSPEG